MTRPDRPLPVSPARAVTAARSGIARIAVDLLGGEGAPDVVVDGALRACSADPDLFLHLIGPRQAADEVLAALRPADRRRVVAWPVEGSVGMADPPIRGVRADTTVRAAVRALAESRADAMVSAGASGAAVTAAVHGLGRIAGIRRPALAATIPARTGPLILLDLGAGTEAKSATLIEHAVLGAAYAALVEAVSQPRIGLLSLASESGRGDRPRRAAGLALRTTELPFGGRYVGPVEGHDVPLGGPADVVVTDGFTGNVLLKAIEGAYALAISHGGAAPAEVPRAAALLGVGGTVVICHGAASGADVATGIELAARLYRLDVSATITAVARDLLLEAPS